MFFYAEKIKIKFAMQCNALPEVSSCTRVQRIDLLRF